MVHGMPKPNAAGRRDVAIRPLTVGDAPALLHFYNHRNAHSRRCFRGLGGETTDLASCERAARDAGDAKTHIDLVAMDGGGAIVGWGFVWKLDTPEPTFGLLVADQAQGRGLGRRLAREALAEADTRGTPEVHLTVVVDNARAIGLYESLGFVDRGSYRADDGLDYRRMVRRRVDQGPDSSDE
jgi:ribosomal protein S18 acetylase RimI-like enzyme